MQIIDNALLDGVTEAARLTPRLRKNFNLHADDASACHRLFNAIEPGAYIRPHRHLAVEKDETFVMVRGSLGIVTFDPSGAVTQTCLISAAGDRLAVDIPHGVYHTAVSLEPGSIFFEAKAGPYLPLSAPEKAEFAPEEGSPEAAAYLDRLVALFR